MERDFLGLSIKHEANEDGVGDHQGMNKKAFGEWGKPKPFTASDFQEAKVFPGAYQWGSVSPTNVFRGGQFSGAFQNAQPLLLGRSAHIPRASSSRSSPQLTIFYGGTVSVFDDISPEKAQAIMLCAASSSSATPCRCRDKPVVTVNAMSMIESFNACRGGSMIPSVPQARKASLARFLEKRKERLMSAMPYKKMLLDLSTGESFSSTA